jgi:hypothetical protein
MDPLGLNYIYGPAIPMTAGQTGLYMLMMQQRMLGIGNGQISGVRPGGTGLAGQRTTSPGAATARTATHTRNSNIPGGQASRYFRRGPVKASQGGAYYGRQLPYFPRTSE